MSHRKKGSAFAERVGEYLRGEGYVVEPEYSIEIGLPNRPSRAHKFDFGNGTTLVECKHYNWTEGANIPSAKISTLNESMLHFLAAPPSFSNKMLFLPETERKGKQRSETLAEHYVRQQGHLIPDGVEVCELSRSGGVRRVDLS